MKKIACLVLLVCAAANLEARAEAGDEARQIAILQSSAAVTNKEDACRQLKLIGTVSSVPALAALLPDEQLSHAATDALATMPFEEAGAVLRTSLRSTSGTTKAGIIHALGERQDWRAVRDLGKLLNDPDTLVASYAAGALGKIGGDDSAGALRKARATSRDPVRAAIVNALLRCASQWQTDGKRASAKAVYQMLLDPKEKEHVRIAAYAGLIQVAGDGGLKLVAEALQASDAAKQTAALQLASNIQNPAATKTFTNLLAKSQPALQIALLGLLQQRGDVAAAPAVFATALTQTGTVRVAAITALGPLGNAAMVPFLTGAAASMDEAGQNAARQALIALRRGNVTDALVAELTSADTSAQVESVRALAARFEKGAVPRLLDLAQSDTPTTRHIAIQALSKLADGRHLPSLVHLLGAMKDDPARDEVRGVFESIVERTAEGEKLDVTSIVEGLAKSEAETQMALLQVSALFADARLRSAIRAALTNSNPQIRATSSRALCSTRDPELMPDLLALAHSSPELNLRALALEGYVRLACDPDRKGFSPAERVELLKQILPFATRVEEQRVVLSGLAGIPHAAALELAEQAAAGEGVRAEAEVASVQIAKALLASDPGLATASLGRLAAGARTGHARTNALQLLKQFDSGWLCAGPYRREGAQCRQLFDIAFAPEKKDQSKVNWRRAPGSADLSRPGEVELTSIAEGDNCVVYLKTRVFTAAAQTAMLEIGSDDGIKLWVNEELVHANNAVRGLVPGQDRAQATLRQGWNDFQAKITQQSAGCGMTLRLTTTDGADFPGLRFDPKGGTR